MADASAKGKVALVTGGNRGIGKEVCRQLADLGVVVLVGARDGAKAQQAKEDLAAEGRDLHPVTLDVSSDESVQNFLANLDDGPGPVDILVNNAGAMYAADPQPATVLSALNVNSVGAYRLLHALVPGMSKRGYGRAVNVSSGMGALNDMGGGNPAYRISKTAMNGVTTFFHASSPASVKVNAVCPGWVRTDMGGASAPRDVEQGASGIVWAATLPDDGPSGGFFRDGKPIAW